MQAKHIEDKFAGIGIEFIPTKSIPAKSGEGRTPPPHPYPSPLFHSSRFFFSRAVERMISICSRIQFRISRLARSRDSRIFLSGSFILDSPCGPFLCPPEPYHGVRMPQGKREESYAGIPTEVFRHWGRKAPTLIDGRKPLRQVRHEGHPPRSSYLQW